MSYPFSMYISAIFLYSARPQFSSIASHFNSTVFFPQPLLHLFLSLIFRFLSNMMFLVACYATLHPALSVRRSVRRSVGPSVRHTLLFLGFCGLWPHCSCQSDQVTSNKAPANPHATGVVVYWALFCKHQYYL